MPKIAHLIVTDLSAHILLENQLSYFRERGIDTHVIACDGRHRPEVVAAGIPYHTVPFTRSVTPGTDLVALARLTRILRRERYDLVHLHLPKPVLLGTMASALAGVPHLFRTIHGFYFHDGSRPATRLFFVNLERAVNPFHEVVFSQNREDIPTAQTEGIRAARRIIHLGNGIDLRRFDRDAISDEARAIRRQRLGFGPDDVVIGFVGRFVSEKGLPELCAAFRALSESDPRLRLLLVGERDARSLDALEIERHIPPDLADRVVCTGWQDEVERYYPLMDVFALPSHREGFPRCAMEASAMGVPIVATDIRGCREAVTHGENGLMVPLGDVDSLTAAVGSLVGDACARARLGAAGRAKARREFDERQKFELIYREYARVLGMGPYAAKRVS